MAGLKLLSILVLCMFVAAPITEAITCGQVSGALAPCINYLRTAGAKAPPPNCCNGVRSINSAAKSTPDRQQACQCLKQAAASVSGIIPTNAEALPGACSVNIPYKISLSTNCNKPGDQVA
ncbi:hypothetical protein JCGZ_00662 [Jatropha curcas]|uniref:Non-specific lipid-transfer protein n=1 Tax=Jatropha curcas TaxID=180498 RepID=A0A067JPD5_JATCU|nr:hypothetical protein JCGZ_00662 [Jatropha curcas]